MDDRVKTRAQREKAHYNSGLRRSAYYKFFSYSNAIYKSQMFRLEETHWSGCHQGRVLELGTTFWRRLEDHAIYPAELYAINISTIELAKGVALSRTSVNRPEFVLMDAHKTAFPDQYFDMVFGAGILHHLDLVTSLGEICRVLKPGGLAYFLEPLDNNIIARVIRAVSPFARTRDERPFRASELRVLNEYLHARMHYMQFTTVAAGIMTRLVCVPANNRIMRAALRVDRYILHKWPGLGPYFREFVVTGSPREVIPSEPKTLIEQTCGPTAL